MQSLLQQFGEQNLVGFMLVLARVSPLFALAPMFSSPLVPVRVRGIVAVALAIGLTPVVAHGQHVDTAPGPLILAIAGELLIGLAFAFVIGALFAAISVAGSFLDTSIGFSFGGQVDPINGTQSSVLTQLYGLIGVLVFIAIQGDAWVVKGLDRTYQLVPLGRLPALGALTGEVQHAFVSIFTSAIEVAGPVMLAMALTDVAFGLVSRVVPQLNVFGVGFPAKVTVGIVLIGVSLPFTAGWLSNALQGSVSDALGALHV